MDELQVRGITSPVLFFPDILDNRIEKISKCFSTSNRRIWLHGQKLHHLPHQRSTKCDRWWKIVDHGKKFNIGLEAGSKPEVHAVLAINTDENSLIICNGYKDENLHRISAFSSKDGTTHLPCRGKIERTTSHSRHFQTQENTSEHPGFASNWQVQAVNGEESGVTEANSGSIPAVRSSLDFLEKAR